MSWQDEMLQLATRNRWTIIGISGATNSGKTTLASKLQHILQPSVVINQDNYFREEDDPKHVWVNLNTGRRHQNWECLECINWEDMCQRIGQVLSKPVSGTKKGFLFLDGHIILNYRPIAGICKEKFFIELDKQTIYRRRLERNYIPADPEGYFDQWVWPMYLQNKQLIMYDNIEFIDGSQSIDFIINLVYNKVKNYQLY